MHLLNSCPKLCSLEQELWKEGFIQRPSLNSVLQRKGQWGNDRTGNHIIQGKEDTVSRRKTGRPVGSPQILEVLLCKRCLMTDSNSQS